jgi:hypothetical protein
MQLTHLQRLEAESIYIMREGVAEAEKHLRRPGTSDGSRCSLT